MMDTLFGDLAPWFTAPALLGTGFLLMQMVLGEVGGDGALDLDIDFDIEADHPGSEFGILSAQSVSAFFMGYGWIGLAAYRVLDIGFTGSALIAVAAGVGVAWLMISLLRLMLRLQNNTNVSIQQAVGLVGEVSITVPPPGQGRGEVVLVINSAHQNYFAVQDPVPGEDPEQCPPIAARSRVRVVRAERAGNIVVVEPSS